MLSNSLFHLYTTQTELYRLLFRNLLSTQNELGHTRISTASSNSHPISCAAWCYNSLSGCEPNLIEYPRTEKHPNCQENRHFEHPATLECLSVAEGASSTFLLPPLLACAGEEYSIRVVFVGHIKLIERLSYDTAGKEMKSSQSFSIVSGHHESSARLPKDDVVL